jgi:hypothetical protein
LLKNTKKEGQKMTILQINRLSLDLVAKDFSDGHAATANNGGPTKTARALAILILPPATHMRK